MRLRNASFYADLAKVVRRGEMMDAERLIEHLRIVGYNQVDVVDMPGDFAHRGGLLDVYPPEEDRPVRVEFFGDEIESIRKFDPESQRSAAVTDEVVLLPLTETPVEEETLAAINARLSGERLAGSEEMIERAVRGDRRHCVSRMGALCSCCRSYRDVLRPGAERHRDPRRTRFIDGDARQLVDEGHRSSRAQPGRQSGASGRSLPDARTMAAAPRGSHHRRG